MARYATATGVSVEKSRAEIERTLQRYGANKFSYAQDHERGLAVIQFATSDRCIRFTLQLPRATDAEFTKTPTGKDRAYNQAIASWEQSCRQRWRALALCLKAKLEAVECGISEFEDEFLAHIVLPDGKTAGQWLRPQLAIAFEAGEMPKTLALPSPE